MLFHIRTKPRKMCVMMLWSSVAVNVGGWRRVAGMEVLATFTSQDPRSGWCSNYVQQSMHNMADPKKWPIFQGEIYPFLCEQNISILSDLRPGLPVNPTSTSYILMRLCQVGSLFLFKVGRFSFPSWLGFLFKVGFLFFCNLVIQKAVTLTLLKLNTTSHQKQPLR